MKARGRSALIVRSCEASIRVRIRANDGKRRAVKGKATASLRPSNTKENAPLGLFHVPQMHELQAIVRLSSAGNPYVALEFRDR